jgi:NADH-quinone oxidoreductase subunit C
MSSADNSIPVTDETTAAKPLSRLEYLVQALQQHFPEQLIACTVAVGEVTLEIAPENLLLVCQTLRDGQDFKFDTLIDICGVDYANYGVSDWETTSATWAGFERGVESASQRTASTWQNSAETAGQNLRFAVVYHLLSVALNQRVRVKVFPIGEYPQVDSVISIWQSANWYEREAFDLFGVIFKNHPDLRRILTDYGFIGHPMRKDFPLVGNVEVRYDAEAQRVIYQPVTIENRVLVPRVIRPENTKVESTNG